MIAGCDIAESELQEEREKTNRSVAGCWHLSELRPLTTCCVQAPAAGGDAAGQLQVLGTGCDDSAAAEEGRHQPRPLHRLAGHHDQVGG